MTLVRKMFCGAGLMGGNATTVPGSPACAPLLAALQNNGLPLTAAYYGNQTTTSASQPPAAGSSPPVVNSSRAGTWRYYDSNEVLVLDIPFAEYAAHQQAYEVAFSAGLAMLFALPSDAVFVNSFAQSPQGGTVLYVDISLPATTSSAVPAMNANVTSLFPPCAGAAAGAPHTGCPSLTLLGALHQFGLPVSNVYYNAEPL